MPIKCLNFAASRMHRAPIKTPFFFAMHCEHSWRETTSDMRDMRSDEADVEGTLYYLLACVAAQHDSPQCLQVLLDLGVDVNEPAPHGTPLSNWERECGMHATAFKEQRRCEPAG
jgi:hypothetical protein